MTGVIVITGAAGNVGAKLRAHLEACGGYDLRLTDLAPAGDLAIEAADLSEAANWPGLLSGAEVVVHLAANPDSTANWAELIAPNVDAVLNLYLAAASQGVRKVILASSVWASHGRVAGGGPIGTDAPDPGANAYGAAKLFAERVAKAFWEGHGISTVIVRLGAVRPGDNPPGPAPTAWEDQVWISNRDACQGLQRAIDADVDGVLIVNLTSDNADSPWSLEAARRALGYEPQDQAEVSPPQQPPSLLSGVKRLIGMG